MLICLICDRYGTFTFNDLVQPPKFLRTRGSSDAAPGEADETRALLAQEALDETAALPADLGQGGFDVVPPHPRGSNAAQNQQQQQHPRSD